MTGTVSELRLVGNRVVLRDFRREDVGLYRHWLLPHHEWHRWDGPYFPRPTPEQIAAAATVLSDGVVRGNWPTPRQRLVVADPGTDALIGTVNWYYVEMPETDWRRVGLVIYDPEYWSAGRGTEAIALWTTYLFSTTDVGRLDFATWSGNLGMCRIGQKLGWTEEARYRDARLVDGERYDGVVYGVLRSEWPAHQDGTDGVDGSDGVDGTPRGN